MHAEAASFKARQSEVFMQYQRMKQDGFAGSFEDFAEETGNPDLAGVRTVQIDDSIETPVPVGAEDRIVPATVESLFYQTPYTTVLGKDDDAIASVETLLAALEGLHVDNVRIEIEGGQELPVMDGSAQVSLSCCRSCNRGQGRVCHRLCRPDQSTMTNNNVKWRPDFYLPVVPSPQPARNHI